MRFLAVALALAVTPACAADNLYPLYAAGRYDDAIRAGTEAGGAEGFAIAARAVMAQAAMQPQPCLPCLQRAEAFARESVAANNAYPDGHVWLAATLGLEGRIQGMIRARANVGGQKRNWRRCCDPIPATPLPWRGWAPGISKSCGAVARSWRD